ncbi:hypothetical protein SY27_14365 [Flavobacterium sp. 316]|uniref:hypothetical protein n=1 Tax=Flavobacterium sp. 316 TaxID=1603293 RepID=UPI0005E56F35|nr:hypothetical protein [Flavobacterium sp. 316]KIX20305.1 hypothetical protein SY27_14365 [Flavobacterium sp. 316]
MKIFLGYLIRVISVFLFLMLILSVINSLFYERHEENGLAYFIGYYLGVFLGFLFFFWLLYKFYKFGSTLISRSKNKSKITEIGTE